MNVYHKWKNSPVIVTFATSQTPIWEIPFPSVTICPEIKSQKDIYNFTEQVLKRTKGNLSDLEDYEFRQMSLVCSGLLGLFNDSQEYDIVTDESAVDFIMKVIN